MLRALRKEGMKHVRNSNSFDNKQTH